MFAPIRTSGSPIISRRQLLMASSAAAAASLPRLEAIAGGPSGPFLLTPGANDLFRVRIELEVEGNVNVPKNPLVSRKSDVKLPLKSDALFDYEERFRLPSGADAGSPVTALERYYHEARNQGVLNRTPHQSELRESVRDTIVRRELLPEVIYSVDDYFQRDELELLRLPVSSAGVDELLPPEAVQVDSVYSPSNESLLSVLNISSVEASDVEAKVVSISPESVKMQLRGKVSGSVDGVPTTIRAMGKLTFDRTVGACTWFAVALHETREIGKAEPGFDVAATVRMLRKPLSRPVALPAKPRPLEILGPIPTERLYVELQSEQLGLSLLMDRRWRMMSDINGAAMMRMIQDDRSIAQCDFRSLVSLEPGAQWTLEALQQDVRQTLGEQFTEFLEADQRLSESGLRVLRVTAAGAVEGVPIHWVVMHFSDDSGRRVLATFTMEGDHVESFAGADTQLASTLQFVPRPEKTGQEVTRASDRGPGDSRVARSNSGETSKEEVQSASDLR